VIVKTFDISGLALVVPRRFEDARGHFAETWSDRRFREAVADAGFVQDNQSLTRRKGTVRGLHYQRPPAGQGKLVRVLAGAILDVAVDVRAGSPTFGRHAAVRLDAREGAQFWVPEGFLHGFCTLEDDTAVAYKVTSYYSPEHDAGVAFDDPQLGIDWPVTAAEAVLSDKDRSLPRFADMPAAFMWQA
jgi:dTDP-4-dehydrorhamnose 3,5-epimerase